MGNVCTALADSHKHSKPKLGGDYGDSSSSGGSHGGLSFTKRLINLSSKKLSSPKKAHAFAPQARSLDSPVWQRTILMGERCAPPEFSGLILYDEYGNSVPDFPFKSPKSPIHPALALVV